MKDRELIDKVLKNLFILISALLTIFFINYFFLLYYFNYIGHKLNVLSNIDELTGLYNRRYFNSVIDSEINRCRRDGTTFLLGMIDIDYFKEHNDRYGHKKGDDTLIYVAETLKKTLNAEQIRFFGWVVKNLVFSV